ncbi:MAG: carbohydrate ABC transporter permease [Arachnia sp.]
MSDPFFWNALKNTITLGFMAIGPQLIIALTVANLLNYRLKGQLFWRVAVIVPYATSVAAATLIFSQLYSENFGLVNGFLTTIGLPSVNWQSGTFASQVAIASIVTWRWVGYNALLYLAAMQAISPEQYEAAALDGAGKFRQFLSITIPEIRGTIIFTVILSTIGGMQLFVEPLLYEGGPTGMQGGLSRQYQTLALYMYQQGWANSRLGYGSAIAFSTLVLIVVLLAVGFILVRIARRGNDAYAHHASARKNRASAQSTDLTKELV